MLLFTDDTATPMTRFKITVGYDGTHYVGWQVQPNGVTVQGKLEEALFKLTHEQVKVHGSGRTDQGVHGHGQVAHFDLQKPFTPKAIMRALNAVLPQDIRIMRIEKGHSDFHARKHAVEKEYRYFIWNAATMPPSKRLYNLLVPQKLDIEAMQKAAEILEGEHDFTAFSSSRKSSVTSTIRTLFELRIQKHGHEVVLVASGSGFLYKMVRSLAGWLLRVGKGEVSPDDTEEVLKSCERTSRVPTAPAHGLFLWRVSYD